ncbi:MAG: hypothetical protein AAGA69_06745, partial [Pseudomonadota bacterium]
MNVIDFNKGQELLFPYSMFFQAVIRGAKDAFRSLGGWGWLLATLAIPPAGFFLHFLIEGRLAVEDELKFWLIYALAGGAAVFFLLLIFNIACAPYRNERELSKFANTKAAQLRKQLNEVETELKALKLRKPTPELEIIISQMIWNGSGTGIDQSGNHISTDQIFGPGAVFILLISIANRGDMPSVANIKDLAVKIGGTDYPLTAHKLDNPFQVSCRGGHMTL